MSHSKKIVFRRALVRLRRLIRHPLRLAGFTLSLLILLTLFHLLTLGLPSSITRRITTRIQENGIPLQIDSISLSPRGWLLHNVRLYSPSPDHLKPLLSTKTLTVSFWPDHWLKLSQTGWRVSATGKDILLSFGPEWEAALSESNPFRRMERLRASLHIDRQKLQLQDSELLWGGLRIHTRGQLNFSDQPSGYSLPEFGAPAAQVVRRLGAVPPEAEPEINIDFHVDSATPEKTSLQVDVYNLSITHNDLTLNPLSCKLALNGNQLSVTGITARVNEGGTLTGTFGIDLSTRAWNTSLQSAGAHPDPVGTLVGPGLQMWIDRAAFTNQLPDVHVNLSHGGTQGSLQMNGTFSAQNFSCTGGPLDTLQVGMAYSNRVLTLAPLHAAYKDQQFDGTVQADFAQKIAQFNITTNGFSPKAIARVLAPDHPSFLEKLTFSGPIQSSGTGQIDYGTWLRHIVHATLRAEQVSLANIQVDVFDSRIDCLGTQLTFTNTTIETCDGVAKGSGEFDILLNDGSAPYHIEARAEQIDFKKLVQQISTNDHSQIAGILSGDINLTADAKAGFWESAQVDGSVSIADGQLANLPLLGGFTHLIQSAIPGFNLFSITTLFADYELSGGKLQSKNVQLGGTLLSAQAKGTYSPDDGLNVRLRAAPLRNTREDKKWYQLHLWSADALKKATQPLFNLLEFELKGSLQDPQWRMKALPKEIYDIIHRDEKPVTDPP